MISINGFFITSQNIDTYLQYAYSDFVMNNFQYVFFEIQADPSLKTVNFANIKKKDGIENSEKYLLM